MHPEYSHTPYFRVGSSHDLSGLDRRLYRFFEILPGALSWFTIILALLLAFLLPVFSAYFIIIFNLYWVFKSLYLSIHLRKNWKRLKYNIRIDWEERIKNLKYQHLFHLVILPFYKEGKDILETNIQSLLQAKGDKKKMAIVLAGEERAGLEYFSVAQELQKKYAKEFVSFIVTLHPKDLPGELAGKASNIAYATRIARKEILDRAGIPYDDVLVSIFDIDTIVYPDYFLVLNWNFCTAENPHRVSYQPVPFFNNNIWQSPALSRVVATSASFWQMIQQERPERLTTFSSQSMSFKALHEIGYWQTNIVSEDSRIFWNCFFAYDGKYETVPLSYPVSMDANLAPNFRETMLNVYRQQRRWCWGVENLPYIFMGFVKNKKISRLLKIKVTLIELERSWSLATNPLLLFLLSWAPLFLGGEVFNTTVLSYNLPIISKYLTLLGVSGIVLSAIISLSFLPPRPKEFSKYKIVLITLQWMFIPATLLVFGSIPALDAQTRLMLGGKFRLGFWVTPKYRIY